jgi:hypothetical protein
MFILVGKPKKVALVRLMRKLLIIINAMIKKGEWTILSIIWPVNEVVFKTVAPP